MANGTDILLHALHVALALAAVCRGQLWLLEPRCPDQELGVPSIIWWQATPALHCPGSPYFQRSLSGCFCESTSFGCQQALCNTSPSVLHIFISFPAHLRDYWPASASEAGTSLLEEVWEVQLLQSFLLITSSPLPLQLRTAENTARSWKTLREKSLATWFCEHYPGLTFLPSLKAIIKCFPAIILPYPLCGCEKHCGSP